MTFPPILALAVTRRWNEEGTLADAGRENELHKNNSAVLKSVVGRKRKTYFHDSQFFFSIASAIIAVNSGSHWVRG